MDSNEALIERPLSKIKGVRPGENLLDEFKRLMMGQDVFRQMFGRDGQRIFVNRLPSYNDSILPLFEMYWGRDNYQNSDVYQSGSIDARIVLPAQLTGKFDLFRKVAATLMRFMGSESFDIFTPVPGLTHFGVGTQFDYSKVLQVSGFTAPVIGIQIPYELDLLYFRQLHPEIDLLGDLDAELIEDLRSYEVNLTDDDQDVLVTINAKAGS